ncbi:hypothetical protein [Actinoplanes sp. NPDC049599]|uniref:hypothetical protein n=1 Tax=Actinoplanes sp. NPDC049599 TaxID=3363903 RepID=UPI00379A1B4D
MFDRLRLTAASTGTLLVLGAAGGPRGSTAAPPRNLRRAHAAVERGSVIGKTVIAGF